MTRSHRIALGIVTALAVGAFVAPTAEAGGHRHRHYSYCAPTYYAPVVRSYYTPTYVAPVVYRPVTYAAPVYYSAPVVSYPAPVYYSAPVYRTRYYAPYRSRGFNVSFGWGRGGRCW